MSYGHILVRGNSHPQWAKYGLFLPLAAKISNGGYTP